MGNVVAMITAPQLGAIVRYDLQILNKRIIAQTACILTLQVALGNRFKTTDSFLSHVALLELQRRQAATDNCCMRRAMCCCLYRDFRPAWRV